MKVKDEELFKAYYCGLCKSINSENGTAPRFALNYDLNFLGIFLSSLQNGANEIGSERCMAHPLKKRKFAHDSEALSYTANVGTMLAYFNMKDDWMDERSLAGLLGSWAFFSGNKKAKKKFERKHAFIAEKIEELSRLEGEECADLDMVTDVFAKIMEEIWNYDGLKSEADKKALKWLGYNLGRWIYILDAFDDIEDDFEKNRYNPIVQGYRKIGEDIDSFKRRVKAEIEPGLTYSLVCISDSFELLDVKKNRDILENIIYLGMRKRMDKVLCGCGGK